MLKRVVTGAVIFVLMCVGIVFQGWVLRLMLLAAALTSMNEMYRAMKKSGARPVEWAGYFSCALAAFLQAASAEFARAQASAESASGSWAAALNRVLPLEGTYLVWIDCSALGLSSAEIVRLLEEEGRVMVNGGEMYGESEGCFIRLNIACPRKLLLEGVERICRTLGGRVSGT